MSDEDWVERSREMAQRYPDDYLCHFDLRWLEGGDVELRSRDLVRMSEYSSTLPTGVYLEKCWRSDAGATEGPLTEGAWAWSVETPIVGTTRVAYKPSWKPDSCRSLLSTRELEALGRRWLLGWFDRSDRPGEAAVRFAPIRLADA